MGLANGPTRTDALGRTWAMLSDRAELADARPCRFVHVVRHEIELELDRHVVLKLTIAQARIFLERIRAEEPSEFGVAMIRSLEQALASFEGGAG